jgi:hypothetical protein
VKNGRVFQGFLVTPGRGVKAKRDWPDYSGKKVRQNSLPISLPKMLPTAPK